jgi:hypothetical protein
MVVTIEALSDDDWNRGRCWFVITLGAKEPLTPEV